MKKLISILAFIIVCQTNYAQVVISLSKKEFISSEIVLNNGDIVLGFIKDFTLPKTIEVRGLTYDFNSIESKLYLDRTKFKFKKEINGTVENLDLADIKSIKLMADDTIKYEKLKLKTINSNSDVVDLEREVMIPLIKEGKINLYGLKVFECSNAYDCFLMYILVYIKKPNDEFAYIPIDFNRINIFNFGKADDKFFKVFEEVGNDCPEFLVSLKKMKTTAIDKNEIKNEYARFEKEKKEKLKQVKNKEEKRKLAEQLDDAYFLKGYLLLIDEYTSKCK